MPHPLYACMYVYSAVCQRERETNSVCWLFDCRLCWLPIPRGMNAIHHVFLYTASSCFIKKKKKKKMNVHFYRCEFYMNRKLFNCDTSCGNVKQAPTSNIIATIHRFHYGIHVVCAREIEGEWESQHNVNIVKLKKWKSFMSCSRIGSQNFYHLYYNVQRYNIPNFRRFKTLTSK